jgi:dolichol-phosphate mannosyltransferase
MTNSSIASQKSPAAISVVVPTYNEAENVETLVKRVNTSLDAHNIDHEIIFIDDHSSDDTVPILKRLQQKYPVRIYTKLGKRGKAFSLLEGFDQARNPFICMIDGDLQYPPEAIAPMARALNNGEADVVVTTRVDNATPFIRRLASKVYNLLFVKLLFGIDYDTQSGLKIFKKDVLRTVAVSPSKWSFDLEFIIRCLQQRFKIMKYSIPFHEREHGVAKVGLFSTTFELAYASLKLKFQIRNSAHKKLPSLRSTYAPKLFRMPARNWLIALIVAAALALVPMKAQAADLITVPKQKAANTAVVTKPISVTTSPAASTPSPSSPAPTSTPATTPTTGGMGGDGNSNNSNSTDTPEPVIQVVKPSPAPVQSPATNTATASPTSQTSNKSATNSPSAATQPAGSGTSQAAGTGTKSTSATSTAPRNSTSGISVTNASTNTSVAASRLVITQPTTVNSARPIAGAKPGSTTLYPSTHLSLQSTAALKTTARILAEAGASIVAVVVVTAIGLQTFSRYTVRKRGGEHTGAGNTALSQ